MLYAVLVGGAGAMIGINIGHAIQAGPPDFDPLVIAIVAGAIGFVLGKAIPGICDKIGERLPADEK